MQDANGFSIAYIYFTDRKAIGTLYSEKLTKRQAYAFAVNFCRWAKEAGERKG